MKQASNIFALTVTGIAVKTYMFVSIAWSKGNEQYRRIHTEVKTISASKTVQPA